MLPSTINDSSYKLIKNFKLVEVYNYVILISKGVDPWLSQTSSAAAVASSDPWAPATVAQPLSKPNQEFDEFTLLGNRSLPTSMY